jgi:uncharacterized protein YlxW (UPF0749 family)
MKCGCSYINVLFVVCHYEWRTESLNFLCCSQLQMSLQTQQTSTQEQLTSLQTSTQELQDRFTTLETSVQSILVTLQSLTSTGRLANGNNNVTTSARGTSAIRAGPAVTPVRTSARGVGVSRTVANPVKK